MKISKICSVLWYMDEVRRIVAVGDAGNIEGISASYIYTLYHN